MSHQRHSIKPPKMVVLAILFMVLTFAAVWASVTVAVEYGREGCPNQVGGTGAEDCR